jgi:hypothetical protein
MRLEENGVALRLRCVAWRGLIIQCVIYNIPMVIKRQKVRLARVVSVDSDNNEELLNQKSQQVSFLRILRHHCFKRCTVQTFRKSAT